jgi:hypothetical protein
MGAILGDVQRAVGPAEVPSRLAALVALPGHHYVDAFTLEFGRAQEWTAEEWARAMFEDDRPVIVRAATRGLLGVMLGRPDPRGTISGYTISESDPGMVRADQGSSLSDDQVIVSVTPGRVSLVTAVRSRTPMARAVWRVLSPLHRSFAPRVLRHAASHLSARKRA